MSFLSPKPLSPLGSLDGPAQAATSASGGALESPIHSHGSAAAQARRVAAAIPEGGLFAEKSWRVSPEPFPLSRAQYRYLEALGPLLHRYQRASDLVYRRSRKGTLPEWIAGLLDAGKPPELLELGLAPPLADALPRVIRPDLILTEDGFAATELDSVPGGIGLTAWLSRTYAALHPAATLVGGADGMLEGFASIFRGEGADILVSEESRDYRPEMEWLAARLEERPGAEGDGGGRRAWEVCDAETYDPEARRRGSTGGCREVYRFFELFDLPNLPGGQRVGEAAARGELEVVSPFKPWLEEKLWSALFWSLPLRDTWRRELRDANRAKLEALLPMSWAMDPAEVPPHAAIPGLEARHFADIARFTQRERDLVLKLSGFSERAWGSRSVTIGSDASQDEWARAVETALESFPVSPYVLQRFHRAKLVRHPWLDPETGKIETMEGRVRLCPYYFVSAQDGSVSLGGVLATICPADKKILHGMSDAILAPCRVED